MAAICALLPSRSCAMSPGKDADTCKRPSALPQVYTERANRPPFGETRHPLGRAEGTLNVGAHARTRPRADVQLNTSLAQRHGERIAESYGFSDRRFFDGTFGRDRSAMARRSASSCLTLTPCGSKSAPTFGEFGVTAVHGISESCEECHVAPWPADVFGRATPGCLEEKRLIEAGHVGEDPLDFDAVHPAVAKIIEVFDRLAADVIEHAQQRCLAGGPSPKPASGPLGPQPVPPARNSHKWLLLHPMEVCTIVCRRSRRMPKRTVMRRITTGLTSSKLIFRRTMLVAVMSPV